MIDATHKRSSCRGLRRAMGLLTISLLLAACPGGPAGDELSDMEPIDSAAAADAVSDADSMPQPDTIAEPDVAAQPDGVAEPDEIADADAVSQPDVVSEPDEVSDADVVAEPDVVTEPDVVSEPDAVTEVDAVTEPDVVSEPDAVTEVDAVTEPDVVTEPDTVTEPDAVTEPDVIDEIDAVSGPDQVSEPDAVTEPDAVSDAASDADSGDDGGPLGDTTAPVFGGVVSAEALSTTEILLTWDAASDDVSPPEAIVYDICISEVRVEKGGCQPFIADDESPAGALEHVLSGLEPNTRYFFVVHARDEAGNADGNLVEATALTPGDRAAKAVTVGGGHACALLARGTVRCWGDNDFGQLGDGTQVSREVAAPVLGLELVKLIAAGADHTCAAIADGTVRCWGKNERGQLGDGTTEDSTVPVVVMGLGFVKALSAGDGHTCAILGDGTMQCWGANDRGQLGDGSFDDRNEPVEVSGAAFAKDVSCGAEHTCAVAADGLVACWGRGDSGQLGHGDLADQNVWTTVEAIELVTNVAAGGAHTCARVGDGTVACWGANDQGQLGGSMPDALSVTPFAIPGLERISSLSAGGTATCARRGDGTLWCIGAGDASIKPVVELTMADAFAASGDHGCARLATGQVACWRGVVETSDGHGLQLNEAGIDGLDAQGAPIQLMATRGTTCAILSSGTVKCWGGNIGNELGNWTSAGEFAPPETVPIQVAKLNAIWSGVGIEKRFCVARGDGTLRCWGGVASSPGLGGGGVPGLPNYDPVEVVNFEDGVALSSGPSSGGTCAATATGQWYCWSGAIAPYVEPEAWGVPLAITEASHVIAGSTLKRFLHASGQIGLWDNPFEPSAWESGIDKVQFLDSDSGLTAVRGDGTVWFWHINLPLNNGHYFTLNVPTQLGGFSHVVTMHSVGRLVLAGLRSDGHIQTWGTGGTEGGYYRLGVANPYASTWGYKQGPGVFDKIFTADQIEYAIDVAVESTISPAACCALIADGTVKCWGAVQSPTGNGKLNPIYIPKVMPYLP